jgi:flagella basal body P-ring formation protein FlgA
MIRTLIILFAIKGALGFATPISDIYGSSTERSAHKPLNIAPQVKLDLRLVARGEEFKAHSSRIFLDMIYECLAAEPVCRDIASLDLGAAPPPAKRKVIKAGQLEKLITAELGERYELGFEGPKTFLVTSSFQTIDRDEVKAVLLAELNRALGPDYQVKLGSLLMPSGLKWYPGRWTWQFHGWQDWANSVRNGDPPQFAPLIKIDAKLHSYRDGQTSVEAFRLRCRPRLLKQVPVAKRTLARGIAIRPEDFSLEWREIRREPVLDLADVSGYRLKRRIRQGSLLLTRAIEPPRMVRRGDEVEVLMMSDGLQLRGRAKALRAGAMGERVPIRLLANRKRMTGKIISSGTVKVVP